MFVDIGLGDYLVHPYTLLFLLNIPSSSPTATE